MNQNEIKHLINKFDKKTKKKICVSFAIACAERCLPVFERNYPDQTPRNAINAAKEWFLNHTKENKQAASAAASAASTAANNATANADNASAAAAYAAVYASYTAAAKEGSSVGLVSNVVFYSYYADTSPDEILWQRQTLLRIVEKYKKDQLYSMLPKKSVVENAEMLMEKKTFNNAWIPKGLLKYVYEYL